MRKLAAAVLTAAVAGGVMGLSPAVVGAQVENTDFCDQVLIVNELFQADEPDPAEAEAALTELVAAAPPEVAPSAQALAGAIQAAGQSGGDPTEDPAFSAALIAIGDYVFANCGWQTAEVDMGEYSFTGLPKTFTAGAVAIKLTNSGAEFHELQALRIKSKDKLKKIVNLPEKKGRKKVAFVGAGFAAPGETGYMFMELAKSGRYGAVCFIPVGSTPDKEDGGDGPPHAHEGMYKEFKVTKASA